MRRLTPIIYVLVLVLSLLPIAVKAQPVPSPRANGELLFSADFNSGAGGLEAVFGPDYQEFEVGEGVATLRSGTADIIAGAAIINRSFGDFIAEVDLYVPTEVSHSCLGLYFRSSGSLTLDDALYSAEICPSEDAIRLDAFRATDADAFFEVDEPLPISYRAGGTNRLRVEAVGDQFTLFVNGVYALSTTESSFASGAIGLTLGIPEDLQEGVTTIGVYDNLRIYAPGVAAPAAALGVGAKPAGAAAAAPSAGSTLTGRVTSTTLNVRSGPGTSFSAVGRLVQGNPVLVTGRNTACSWLQVSGSPGGWVSATFIELDGQCGVLPDASSTGGMGGSSAASGGAAAAPAPAAAAVAAGPEVLQYFETLGSWKRGDEAWGTLEGSTAQAVSGSGSAKLAYVIPANVVNNYVVFSRSLPMAGRPNRLSLQVYGDGSGNLLNAWVTDATGQVWQFHFGPVNHTGWKRMEAVLDPASPWPTTLISGSTAEKRLDYPATFTALVLDNPGNGLSTGALYFDDLTALTR